MAMLAAARNEDQAEWQDTRRMHERVRGYWLSLKDNRRYPHEGEVDPLVIADAWDHCFVVDMRKGSVARGFSYTYMGPALMKAYGVNMASLESCNAATAPHIASMLRHFDEVAESGEPSMDASEFENAQRVHIKYRCCLLPLGNERVEYILGCMRWKEC